MNIIKPQVKIIKVEEGPNKGKSISLKRNLGHLNIMSTDLPESKEWKIQEEYDLNIKVKVSNVSSLDEWDIREGRGTAQDYRLGLDITNISIPMKKSKEDKES